MKIILKSNDASTFGQERFAVVANVDGNEATNGERFVDAYAELDEILEKVSEAVNEALNKEEKRREVEDGKGKGE